MLYYLQMDTLKGVQSYKKLAKQCQKQWRLPICGGFASLKAAPKTVKW
jgi:hypothetical protein